MSKENRVDVELGIFLNNLLASLTRGFCIREYPVIMMHKFTVEIMLQKGFIGAMLG